MRVNMNTNQPSPAFQSRYVLNSDSVSTVKAAVKKICPEATFGFDGNGINNGFKVFVRTGEDAQDPAVSGKVHEKATNLRDLLDKLIKSIK